MTDLVPLIGPDLHGRLKALRAELRRAGIGSPAHVFVPVGAATNTMSLIQPRVLFVGKATRGYGEPRLSSFAGSKKGAAEVVEDWLPNPGHSAFWQFARAILRQVLRSCDIEASDGELLRFSGWSNLAKIGDVRRNPSAKSIQLQKGLCVEALTSEIAYFEPTAIVLMASDYAREDVIYPVFGPNDCSWRVDPRCGDSVEVRISPELNSTVIWTNHPQGMPAGERAKVRACVADLVMTATRTHLSAGGVGPSS